MNMRPFLEILAVAERREKREKRIRRSRERYASYFARYIREHGPDAPVPDQASIDPRKLPRKLEREYHCKRLQIRVREWEWRMLKTLCDGRRGRTISKVIRQSIPGICKAFADLPARKPNPKLATASSTSPDQSAPGIGEDSGQ